MDFTSWPREARDPMPDTTVLGWPHAVLLALRSLQRDLAIFERRIADGILADALPTPLSTTIAQSIRLSSSGLARTALDRAQPTPPPPSSVAEPDWAPSEGWGFCPGRASLDGKEILLREKQLGLLNALAKARRPLTWTELISQVWPDDDQVERSNLRSHLAGLRKSLRAALDFSDQFDPIPNTTRGKDSAWELHKDLHPRR